MASGLLNLAARRVFRTQHEQQSWSPCMQGDERGAVLVESMIVLLLQIMLIIAVIDFSRISFQVVVGQYAVGVATRWGAVGSIPDGTLRAEAIRNRFAATMRRFGVFPFPERLRICPAAEINCSSRNAGIADEVFYVGYSMPVRILFIDTGLEIATGTYARNEPF